MNTGRGIHEHRRQGSSDARRFVPLKVVSLHLGSYFPAGHFH